MTKLRIVCATAALAATASGSALAETTANIGIMSDYIFRGVYQAASSAFAGLDIESDSGFYMGMWGADLEDGLEYDIYLGYGRSGETFDWYAGYTGYYYTDEFDDTYEELNAGFTYGFLTIDYALGDYKANGYSEPQTYQYVGATFAPEMGPYYFLGRTDYKNIDREGSMGRYPATGANGYWVEIGKSFELMEDLEINVAALYSGDIPQGNSLALSSVQLGPDSAADSEYALTVTLTKTIRTSY